jgi:tetratricopeptide (TPR) repeat protein
MNWRITFFVFVLFSAMLLPSRLLVVGLRDFAVVEFVHILLGYSSNAATCWDTVPSERTTRPEQVYKWALSLDPGNTFTRWGLGRVALASGDYETAVDMLRPLTADEVHNPVLYLDILDAFSYGGMPQELISFCAANPPPQQTRVITDALTLAHLDLGELEQALVWRPGDLYVNYQLWRKALGIGNIRAADIYSRAVVYFPPEAIDITNERLLGYTVQTIPELLEAGLWSHNKTLDVVSYLVWQYHHSPQVVRLLETMSERYPSDPDWSFYLGELHHRRGDLDQAMLAYQRALEISPDYVQAYLQLGMVNELQMGVSSDGERLQEAISWYRRYQEAMPDDLLGLKKLLAVYQICDQPEKASLRERWLDNTEERRIVAELLDITPGEVDLGPNLVSNGGFERWIETRPDLWKWSDMFNREPFDAANFVTGADELFYIEGQKAGRIHGFWFQHEREKSEARAGFWERGNVYRGVDIKPDAVYLISFYYSTTSNSSHQIGVWLSTDPDLLAHGDYWLSGTGGSWHKFVALVWHKEGTGNLFSPLLRSWGTGSVYFDDAKVMQVNLVHPVVINLYPIVEIFPKPKE